MKKYKECLDDVSLAIASGYPADLHHKLYDRRGKCFLKEGKTKDAENAFEAVLKRLDSSKLSQDEKSTWKRNTEKLIKDCKNPKKGKPGSKSGPLPVLPGKANAKLQGASGSLKVVYINELEGRSLVATKNIAIGDVLVVESPYAAVSFHEMEHDHCHHCVRRTIAPVGCQQCANVRYCSTTCRDASWERYHHIECGLFDLLHSQAVGHLGHLAFRTAIIAGYETLRKQAKQDQAPVTKTENGTDEDEVYGSNYSTVCNLITHPDKDITENVIRNTVLAAILSKMLQGTAFFKDQNLNTDEMNNALVDLTAMILNHIQIVHCNSHEISEMMVKAHEFTTAETRDCGLAVYGVSSLFNHSCNPNVEFYYHGSTVVAKAVRDIPSGEEALVSYGPVFYIEPRESRHKRLWQLGFFKCGCEACKGNWALQSDMEEQLPVFKCKRCRAAFTPEALSNLNKVLCQSCGHVQDLRMGITELAESHNVYAFAMEQIFKGDYTSPLDDVTCHMRLLDLLIDHPWRDFVTCLATVQQIFRLQGNTFHTK